jgi:hypothetical protein
VKLHARGHLCPVCLRTAPQGVCTSHGPWKSHQLLTSSDRRRAARGRWQPFEPAAHACPRCLGEVAESRAGFGCIDHGHDHEPHGPYRVDELLAPTAQRESAATRQRLARHHQSQRREPVTLSLPALPDPARSMRVLAAASVIAATLAFLVR